MCFGRRWWWLVSSSSYSLENFFEWFRTESIWFLRYLRLNSLRFFCPLFRKIIQKQLWLRSIESDDDFFYSRDCILGHRCLIYPSTVTRSQWRIAIKKPSWFQQNFNLVPHRSNRLPMNHWEAMSVFLFLSVSS